MRKKLKWGCKVKPTEKAIKGFVCKKDERGIFLGYHKDNKRVITVVKTGNRTVNYYHVVFWVED